MKKIILFYNLNRGKHDYEAEFDSENTINAIEQILSKEFFVTKVEADRQYASWIQELLENHPDLIFNIAEGYSGVAREAFYPALFEQLGLRYSGPDPTNLLICLNKHLTKTILSSSVPVPSGIIINSLQKFDGKKLDELAFPVIVKPNAEGSSLGIISDSIVSDLISLKSVVERLRKNNFYNLLIEKYIDGIDVSMAYVEGLGILGPSRVEYPKIKIYDRELKTVNDKDVSIQTFEQIPSKMRGKLITYTESIIKTLDLKGYAKIDFRIDAHGGIYLLEVNSQISFHPEGEFAVAAKSNGIRYEDLVLHIAKNALITTRVPSIGHSANSFINAELAYNNNLVYNEEVYGI